MLASDDRPAVWQHTCAPMPVIMTFSERLRLRKSIWWNSPGGWRNRSTWHRPVHRWLDRVRLRDRSWPLERWCCCDQWQRCLNNKWNAREFAALHGVAVPELYWSGRRVDDLPINDLPDNYVIRPAWGAGGLETFVMAGGVELLSLQRMSRSEVIERLRNKVGSVARFPILAEQFLANEQGHYERGVEYTFMSLVTAWVSFSRSCAPVSRVSGPRIIPTGRCSRMRAARKTLSTPSEPDRSPGPGPRPWTRCSILPARLGRPTRRSCGLISTLLPRAVISVSSRRFPSTAKGTRPRRTRSSAGSGKKRSQIGSEGRDIFRHRGVLKNRAAVLLTVS